jgi:VWFA-related protein
MWFRYSEISGRWSRRVFQMQRLRRFAILFLATMLSILLPLCVEAAAQQGLPEAPEPQPAQSQPAQSQPGAQQSLPEAPSVGEPAPPSQGEASSADTSAAGAAAAEKETPEASPAPVGRVLPSNRVANAPSSGYDETSGIIRVNVSAVPVPVTVKDSNGHLFPGLTKDNFSVYEDGVKQRVSFFTSDPFPVSAAIIIDVGMPEIALRKIKETFGAMIGSFSQFDELSIYTYGTTVNQRQDYLAALGDSTTRTLGRIEEIEGRTAGPAAFNPMTVGPTVNGEVFDQGTQHNSVDFQPPSNALPSTVLNDALLRAAMDLGRREKARRRVIFVLSDGREFGSHASYKDVLKVLLTYNVSVYGVENDIAALPGYNRIAKIHLPGQGYGNILPKYASATGGEIFTEFTQRALEACYSSAMEQARSQYTLVYNTSATASTSYRKIEVRVSGYGSSLKVYARDGYYPTPQAQ